MKNRTIIILTALMLDCGYVAAQNVDRQSPGQDVKDYIQQSWKKTLRYNPKDSADHIGLPKPYTVPCISGHFQEMYYWDTYFTNVGLLLDGHIEWAIDNTENLASLVERFGKVFNGSRYMYRYNSQPPYLCMMVADIYARTGDKEWLGRMFGTLEKEYRFWMTHRMTPCGLNRYSNDVIDKQKDRGMAQYAKSRTKCNIALDSLSEREVTTFASHARAECESGWDFTPRFENRCEDFCPVDLNANLYYYEQSLARFCRILGMPLKAGKWEKAARRRKRLIQEYMYNAKDCLYHDYDYVNRRLSPVRSAAVFSLLFSRVLSAGNARSVARHALKVLEFPYGIAATEKNDYHGTYQWAYPNGWAPLQYIAIKGLENYGMTTEAYRLAHTYVDGQNRIFAQTHNLWEKYNVVEGSTRVTSEGEYNMPPMMGWTAGVYLYALQYVKRHKHR
ncbi:trehalase family glycosidase [Prevotella denticola]|uniref:trehalase family glycosidase n=1 Tax=Prevotella denticola TaxID=28129 RepID=UPI00242BEED6|nr:trehalase family glycosidase [Prevotella denticola]